MESTTSSKKVLVCQTCGDEGFNNAFVYCVKCLGFVIHRYCLDVIPRTSDEFVSWFCEDCKPAVPYKFTSQKHEPSPFHKEDATNLVDVKTTHCKKKKKNKPKKKRKLSSLVAAGENGISCPEKATKPDRECVSPINSPLKETSMKSHSGPNQITTCVVSQKQYAELENGSLLKGSVLQKEDATSLAHVKTTHRKKKKKNKSKKKSKIVPKEATKADREKEKRKIVLAISSPLKKALLKSYSGPNQITPCVISRPENDMFQQSSESAELDNCSPLKECARRKRDATSLAIKTKKHKTDSIEHSWCDSSCTDVTLQNKESLTHFVEARRCEITQCEVNHDKLVHNSSSIEKKTKDNDGQTETANQMHNEQEMRVNGSGAVVDASQSIYSENVHYIHYQPARPVLNPVWRGSFNITQTDYDIFEGFVGHLSNKACYKVCEEANTLPSLLSLEMHSKTALWPKSFLESHPSDENIALYFFPGYSKRKRDFERLVNDMINEDLAMKATAKNAELLIFASTVLPVSYWRFQGNYYLWGVFRGKRNDSPDVAVSNNSDNHGLSENSRNEVTSGKEILTKIKTFDSQSPQSPLCNYR